MTPSFEQAKSLFLEGIQHFEAGHFEEAEQRFTGSLIALPGRASTLTNRGATRLRLGRPQDALADLELALATNPDDAEAWAHRGVALGELGRVEEALVCDDKVIALVPDSAPAWLHRGLMLTHLSRHTDALAAFEQLTKINPQQGEAWLHHGEALLRLAREKEALASFDKCLTVAPDAAFAWGRRGAILKQLDRPEEAAEAFERAIALGHDVEMNAYLLASVANRTAPATAPRRYVQSLFDGYADDFDKHLVEVLHYQAHTVLVEHLRRLADRSFASVLDLGCGTGLSAPLLRPIASYLEGVDLSAKMVERSRALSLYNKVFEAELVDHLAATPRTYDLLVATDVFIYIGDLAPAFAGVRRVIDADGIFCFSVEQAGNNIDFMLQARLTYAHSESYLRKLAAQHGFEVLEITSHPVREDQRVPVMGLYAYLKAA
jgi:predicted TPR repeat methyltransferase